MMSTAATLQTRPCTLQAAITTRTTPRRPAAFVVKVRSSSSFYWDTCHYLVLFLLASLSSSPLKVVLHTHTPPCLLTHFSLQALGHPGDAVDKGVGKVKQVLQDIKDTQTENKKHQPKDEGEYVQVEVEESNERKADKVREKMEGFFLFYLFTTSLEIV